MGVSVVRLGFCVPIQEERMRHKENNKAHRFVSDGMLEFSDPADGDFFAELLVTIDGQEQADNETRHELNGETILGS